jgi:hypothetical protein
MDETNLADLHGLDPIPRQQALEALENRLPGTCNAMTPTVAFGVAGAEPHGATRWRF